MYLTNTSFFKHISFQSLANLDRLTVTKNLSVSLQQQRLDIKISPSYHCCTITQYYNDHNISVHLTLLGEIWKQHYKMISASEMLLHSFPHLLVNHTCSEWITLALSSQSHLFCLVSYACSVESITLVLLSQSHLFCWVNHTCFVKSITLVLLSQSHLFCQVNHTCSVESVTIFLASQSHLFCWVSHTCSVESVTLVLLSQSW